MKIKPGEYVSWQRTHNAPYSGVVVAFCPAGTAIADVLDLSCYSDSELRRIDLERNGINRYLIYVQNVGVVSVASKTIEKQNLNAVREE